MKKIYVILSLFLTHNTFSNLDTTFGFGNGYVQTSVNGLNDVINKIKIQSNSLIVAAGSSTTSNNPTFALARYDTDGSLDTTGFNASGTQPGVVTTEINGYSTAYNVDIQSDGKIVAVGYTFDGTNGLFALARYTTAGVLDTTFNSNGIVTTLIGSTASIATCVKVQSDNKLAVGGSAIFDVPYFAVARYDTDGSLDETFNASGSQPGTVTTLIGFTSTGNALAIDANENILLAGNSDSQFALARYTTGGILDTTNFNSGGTQPGTVVTSIGSFSDITALAIQTDSKIVAAGSSDNQVALARYNDDGTLDTNYGTNGIVTSTIGSSSTVYDMKLQSDDKAVICGATSLNNQTHIFLARYNTDGTVDTSFGTDGIILIAINEASQANGLDIDANGKFVIGGSTQINSQQISFLLARFKEGPNLITISNPANNRDTTSQVVAIDGVYTGTNNTINIYIDDVFFTSTTGTAGAWDVGNSPILTEGFHTVRADILNDANDVIDSDLNGFTIDLIEGVILNYGQTGPLVIGTTDNTTMSFITNDTARINIDENGSVTTFSNYKLHAYQSGTQTTSGTTPLTVLFQTEVFDPNNNFASGVYTAPATGYYSVAVNVAFTSSNDVLNGNQRSFTLVKNGTPAAGYSTVLSGWTATGVAVGTEGEGPYSMQSTAIIQLNAGDTLRVDYTNNDGGTDTIATNHTHISISYNSF